MSRLNRFTDTRFAAAEFGPFQAEVAGLLEEIGACETQLSIDYTRANGPVYGRYINCSDVDSFVTCFRTNLHFLQHHFVQHLTTEFLKFTIICNEDVKKSIKNLAANREEAKVFAIHKRDDGALIVKLPFQAGPHREKTKADAALPIKPTALPATFARTDGTSGGSCFVVTEELLNNILKQLKLSIQIQRMATGIAGLMPSIEIAKARVGGEKLESEHGYRDIWSGSAGIAWGACTLWEVPQKAFYSFFEERPQNNLERTIRLFSNYLNPLKKLGHSHWKDANELVERLNDLKKDYESGIKAGKRAEMDALIFVLLKDYFTRCNAKAETGSYMRRIIMAMTEIYPALASALPKAVATVIPATSTPAGAGIDAAGGFLPASVSRTEEPEGPVTHDVASLFN